MKNVDMHLTDDQKIFRSRGLPIRQRMEAWINHVATFYNASNRAVDGDACVYHATPTSPGCAIGKELEKPVPLSMEDRRVTALYVANEEILPPWMMDFDTYFLSRLQHFHDNRRNWQADGLSEDGLQEQTNFLKAVRSDFYK